MNRMRLAINNEAITQVKYNAAIIQPCAASSNAIRVKHTDC